MSVIHKNYIPDRIGFHNGFSMVEILVTLVIISTALFGTAGLQVYSMMFSKSSQNRTQAAILSSDIVERMEANKLGSLAGAYAVATASSPSAAATVCSTASCDSTALAKWDLDQWGNSIALFLPDPTWTVTYAPAGATATYQILITWNDRSTDQSSRTEKFSYTATRTVSK